MLNSSRTSRQFFAVFATAGVVVVAELLAKDGEAVVAAPAEITGIQAPVLGYLSSLEDARIIVPELKAPALSAPAVPDLELVVWRAEGVIPAPTAVIDVEAPDVGALPSLEDAVTRGRKQFHLLTNVRAEE